MHEIGQEKKPKPTSIRTHDVKLLAHNKEKALALG